MIQMTRSGKAEATESQVKSNMSLGESVKRAWVSPYAWQSKGRHKLDGAICVQGYRLGYIDGSYGT
jgi:hypothetical protein